MKKGEFQSEPITQPWTIRASGFPRLLVECSTKQEAEIKYRERFQIWKSKLNFVECAPCQPLQKISG
jgi:hypothetical protein